MYSGARIYRVIEMYFVVAIHTYLDIGCTLLVIAIPSLYEGCNKCYIDITFSIKFQIIYLFVTLLAERLTLDVFLVDNFINSLVDLNERIK